uniref:Uncharacterized protein n=1 Tax=Arundo donax TaxID=35708 RepID=A0A0A9FMG6_ARUDO
MSEERKATVSCKLSAIYCFLLCNC